MKTPKSIPSDPFGTLVGYHLRRASVAVMTDLTQVLAPLSLTPVSASVLFMVGSHAGLKQSDIGRTLGILRANMAPLMASLIRKGLVLRTRLDGRSQAVRLSATGEALVRQAWDATQRHERKMFGAMTPQQRDKMTANLRGIWESGT